ncbi:MAG: hypothetical protein ACT4PU_02085 [Planctomycetota bacterium]
MSAGPAGGVASDADTAARASRARRRGLLAGVLLLLAGFALLYVPRERVPLFFDIQGYTAQALSLLAGRGNTIRVGESDIPGYYPAGLPVLLLPPLAVLGPDMRHGAWTVLGFALLALGGSALLARRFGGGVTAGLCAGLLLLTAPLFRDMSGQIMTQVPTGAVIMMVALLYTGGAERTQPRRLFLAGLLASVSLLLRYANLTFPAALFAAELLGAARGGRERMPRLLQLSAGLAAGALLVALHNTWVYGGPLTTGYAVWGHELGFSWRNLFWPEGAPNRPAERWVLTRALAGFSDLQTSWMAAAALVGLFVVWSRRQVDQRAARLARLAVLTLLFQGVFLGLYSFRSTNYLLPGVPLTAALAGVGLTSVAGPRRGWLALCLCAALLAWSLAHELPPTETELNAIAHHDVLAVASQDFEESAVLITTADPGLAEGVVREGHPLRSVLYLGPHVSPVVEQAARRELDGAVCSPQHVLQYAQRQLQAGRPVYLDQNPPPRGATKLHAEIRQALRGALDFQKTSANNIARLTLRPN